MSFYRDALRSISAFGELASAAAGGRLPAAVTGLSPVHKALFALGLQETLQKPLLLIADDAAASRLCDDINTMLGSDAAAFFPARDAVLRDQLEAGLETQHARLSVLARLLRGELLFVAAPPEAAAFRLLPPEALRRATVRVRVGDALPLQAFCRQLVALGYARRPMTDGICQFSLRGGILDIYPPGAGSPLRLEFWGDAVDAMWTFDLLSQRRAAQVDEIEILPAAEALFQSPESGAAAIGEMLRDLPPGHPSAALLRRDRERLGAEAELFPCDRYLPQIAGDHTLLDYFDGGAIALCEGEDMLLRLQGQDEQAAEEIAQLLSEGAVAPGFPGAALHGEAFRAELLRRPLVLFEAFPRKVDLPLRSLSDVHAVAGGSWSGEVKELEGDLRYNVDRGYCTALYAGTDKNAKILAADLAAAGFPAAFAPLPLDFAPGRLYVLPGTLSSSFEFLENRLSVISYAHVAQVKVRARRKKPGGESIGSLEDIAPGDLIVHSTHGIGVYGGIHKLELHGIVKDYIKIAYAGKDVLYIPVTQLDLVAKYIGPGDHQNVKLSRIGSQGWHNQKRKVRIAAAAMAKELIALYAKRQRAPGFAFYPDDNWQREFESRFPYDETDDQLRCIEEIKADMERPHPMDRLLCGDVGFGKTEVALRAAFKAVMSGKQVAILVPTTILAWQHYNTILGRLESFPISVELMSRFRSKKQQAETAKNLALGKVDIVVGTHRLVQKDIRFKNLGLAVIDEEQRFGVAHKEKLKELYPSIDILTLSATPIPRTLNMAMTGIRDMSVIEEPPQDRLPVQTYVAEYSEPLLHDAIRREMRRGGQVYYLHNRIESIDRVASRLLEAFPDRRIAVAHGRMAEEELSAVWQKLLQGEIDILVCTSIIEAGVDVPTVNTLVVEDSDRLGLAQLYQLRGRVGRSSRRAYAYFTFFGGRAMSEIAMRRLAAIRDFTKFGSGFKIAMRDLEIRGAGSVLSTAQHGHIEAVGYDMYMRLLSDAVAELRGERSGAAARDCLIDIRMSAHIPDGYIEDSALRIEAYRGIAGVATREDGEAVLDELRDRYGEVPDSVRDLVEIAFLRTVAASYGIYEVKEQGGKLTFYLDNPPVGALSQAAKAMPGRLILSAGRKPYFAVTPAAGQSSVDALREALTLLGNETAAPPSPSR